jgi:phenylacetate-CoA ligase
MSLCEKALYRRSPVWLQEQMLSARARARRWLREGPSFRRELQEKQASERLDAKAMAQLQWQRLSRTLVLARQQVPYYRELGQRLGWNEAAPGSAQEFSAAWPLLQKADVFAAGSALLSERARGPRFSASTSGTTGMSMTAWRDLHAIQRENAFIWRYMGWAGMKPGDRRVWLRGDRIVPAAQLLAPYWRYSAGDALLMASSYHLSEATAEAYLREMERFDPVVIQAYPSAVLLLARYLVDKGRRWQGRSLRSVVTSSETVTAEHRRVVREAFGVTIFDWYGSMERVVGIGNCEHGNYHVHSDYGFAEFLPAEDGMHEVVGTSFDNHLMPFIRYRLGDHVRLAEPGFRCPCGRAFPVVSEISGRVEDYLLSPSGRKVFMGSNILDYLNHILEGQVRQDEPGEIKVLLVPAPGHGVDEAEVRRRAHELFGPEMRVQVQQVDAVPRTKNGKLRAVVRNI